MDDSGRCWALLLKKWTTSSSAVPRPIFVLERSAECMAANRAVPGKAMQLYANAGTLRMSIVKSLNGLAPPRQGASRAAAGRSPSPAASGSLRGHRPPRWGSVDVETVDSDTAAAGRVLMTLSRASSFTDVADKSICVNPSDDCAMDSCADLQPATPEKAQQRLVHRPTPRMATLEEGQALYASVAAAAALHAPPCTTAAAARGKLEADARSAALTQALQWAVAALETVHQ